jgi:hypothetical protein
MALGLDFEICQSNDCSTIKYSETTGAYDSNNNRTGWGSPNPAIPSFAADVAVLNIEDPDGNTWSLDITAGDDGDLTVTSDNFPNTDDTISYTITPEDVGQTGTFTDGLYTFTYEVTVSSTVYKKVKKILIICSTNCCVNKMLADLADNDCACDDDITNKVRLANLLLWGVKAAARCGNTDQVSKMIKQINKLCGSNSSTCNCNE